MTPPPTITAADARDEWVLVPREPTPEMCWAWSNGLNPLSTWKGMIDAAPKPPETAGEDEPVDTWKSVSASLTTALSDERDYSLALRALLAKSREYVAEALEAHEHSDGRALLSEIDAALKAQFAPTKQAAVSDGVVKVDDVRKGDALRVTLSMTARVDANGTVYAECPDTAVMLILTDDWTITRPTTQEGGEG